MRWVLLLFVAACAGNLHLPELAGRSIVIVQAHPDDEQNLAPLLVSACKFNGARCHFIVLADAQSYGCAMVALARHTTPLLDPDACSELRRAEMRSSVALIGATVEFLGLPDLFYAYTDQGRDRTLAEWRIAYPHLVQQMRTLLADADVVFALDPRHGSSCHPAHRAASKLAVDAIAELPKQPEVWFEETSDLEEHLSPADVAILDHGGMFVWRYNRAPVAYYDDQQAHEYRDAVHRIHKTQDLAPGTPIPDVPGERKRIPLVRLSDIDPSEDQCTALGIQHPTWDLPGNRDKFLERIQAAR